MSDLLRTLAAVYRRRAAPLITKHDFKHALSLDLRWFAPADAKRLLERAIELRLLKDEGDGVRLAFDPAAVEVPIAFRPSLDVLEEVPKNVPPPPGTPAPAEEAPPAPLLERVRAAVAEATGYPLDMVQKEMEEERARRANLLTREVAALVVARRRGVDVRPFLAEAYASLKTA